MVINNACKFVFLFLNESDLSWIFMIYILNRFVLENTDLHGFHHFQPNALEIICQK